MPATRPVRERFEEKFTKDEKTACWIWTASFGGAGYGQFAMTRTDICGAHVASWRIYVGEIPEGYDVHHARCRNKACVNPHHLDLMLKGLHGAFHSPKKDKCANGHEYKEGSYYNAKYKGKEWRQCKQCCKDQYTKNHHRYKFGPIHLAASTG